MSSTTKRTRGRIPREPVQTFRQTQLKLQETHENQMHHVNEVQEVSFNDATKHVRKKGRTSKVKGEIWPEHATTLEHFETAWEEVVERVREVRSNWRMTYTEMAEIIGTSGGTLSLLLSNKYEFNVDELRAAVRRMLFYIDIQIALKIIRQTMPENFVAKDMTDSLQPSPTLEYVRRCEAELPVIAAEASGLAATELMKNLINSIDVDSAFMQKFLSMQCTLAERTDIERALISWADIHGINLFVSPSQENKISEQNLLKTSRKSSLKNVNAVDAAEDDVSPDEQSSDGDDRANARPLRNASRRSIKPTKLYNISCKAEDSLNFAPATDIRSFLTHEWSVTANIVLQSQCDIDLLTVLDPEKLSLNFIAESATQTLDALHGTASCRTLLLNTGGYVSKLEWAPVVNRTTNGTSGQDSHVQYLAVASHGSVKYHAANRLCHGMHAIQIWSLSTSIGVGSRCECSFSIVSNHGPVFALLWYPRPLNSTVDTESGNSIGIIAAGFGDGTCALITVPHPNMIQFNPEQPASTRALVMELLPHRILVAMPPLTNGFFSNLSWTSSSDGIRLAAGSTSGIVCVWNLTTESGNSTEKLVSIWQQRFGYMISSVAWNPLNLHQLAIAYNQPQLTILDLRCSDIPVFMSPELPSVSSFGKILWLKHFPHVIICSCDDAFRFLPLFSVMKPVGWTLGKQFFAYDFAAEKIFPRTTHEITTDFSARVTSNTLILAASKNWGLSFLTGTDRDAIEGQRMYFRAVGISAVIDKLQHDSVLTSPLDTSESDHAAFAITDGLPLLENAGQRNAKDKRAERDKYLPHLKDEAMLLGSDIISATSIAINMAILFPHVVAVGGASGIVHVRVYNNL